MSESQTARLVYRRNGSAGSTGDARFTLDPEASEGIEETDYGFFADLPDGATMGLKRNVYLPDGWKPSEAGDDVDSPDEVDHYVVEVGAGIPHAVVESSEGSAEPISDEEMLARNGETEALADLLASVYDGVGKVTAQKIAEQRVARHAG